MKVIRSAWIVPVETPPVRDGAVAVDDDGTIAAVGGSNEVLARWGGRAERDHGTLGVTDLGAAVLLPGLVNAHTHVELSWMAQAPPPRGDFLSWVRAMVARETPAVETVERGVARAVAAIAASGAAAAGDVGNTLAALPLLRGSSLAGRFFLEVIGWSARGLSGFDEAARVLDEDAARAPAAFPGSVVPHGPHSVSPEVFALVAERARARGDVVSVHLAESREEDALLRRGDGPVRALLDEIGALPPGWEPPRLSPAEVLDRAGLLGPRTLAVHGVHLTREDARLVASRGATVVLCPRSNAWLGVGAAPVAMLLQEGVRLALGTDSLASNEDLDLLTELAALRALAPGAPAPALVRAATLGGAEALGLGEFLGSIAPGKRGPLLALPMIAPGSGNRPGAVAGPGTGAAVAGPGAASQDDEPYRSIFGGPSPAGRRILRF